MSRGVEAVTGMRMRVFPKRRFQHGALPEDRYASPTAFAGTGLPQTIFVAIFVSILSISQLTSFYPATNLERDKWVLERRPARETLDPQKPYLFFVEQELSASGEILPVATIFLTNRECPWRCVMCDLWRNTLTTSVPPGAIPAQIDFALSQLPAARVLKLYNSGSFFDCPRDTCRRPSRNR